LVGMSKDVKFEHLICLFFINSNWAIKLMHLNKQAAVVYNESVWMVKMITGSSGSWWVSVNGVMNRCERWRWSQVAVDCNESMWTVKMITGSSGL